jgi:hypothetical protein
MRFATAALFLPGSLWLAAANAQQPPAPEPAIDVDAKLVEELFECVSPGLTPEWNRAWINFTSVGSYDVYLAELYVSNSAADTKGKLLETPCGPPQFGEFVRRLNEYLTPAQKKWPTARISFFREGRFEFKFDKP